LEGGVGGEGLSKVLGTPSVASLTNYLNQSLEEKKKKNFGIISADTCKVY